MFSCYRNERLGPKTDRLEVYTAYSGAKGDHGLCYIGHSSLVPRSVIFSTVVRLRSFFVFYSCEIFSADL